MDWEDLKVSFFEKCIESIAWVFRLTASQHHKILYIKRYYRIAPAQSSAKSKKHSWWKYYLFAEVTTEFLPRCAPSCQGQNPGSEGGKQEWATLSLPYRQCELLLVVLEESFFCLPVVGVIISSSDSAHFQQSKFSLDKFQLAGKESFWLTFLS